MPLSQDALFQLQSTNPPPPRALNLMLSAHLAGLYYLRTRAAADAIKFTVDQAALKNRKSVPQPNSGAGKPAAGLAKDKEAQMAAMLCSLENKDACLSCGS